MAFLAAATGTLHAQLSSMSEAAAEKPAAAPAPGGNKKLLLMVLIFNVLIAGGLVYLVLAGRSHGAEQPKKAEGHGEEAAEEGHHEKEEEEEEEEEAPKHGGSFGPLLEVGSFVANLAASAQNPSAPARYAKVSLFVEAKDEEAKAKVEAALVPIKAEALMFLSNAKPEDVIGPDKIKILSEELQKRIAALVGKKLIKRVYFSELVVQ